MGTRGPKKKSEATKRATGDLRKQKKNRAGKKAAGGNLVARKENRATKPAAGEDSKPAIKPSPPTWLSKAARVEWQRVKPHLIQMNTFSAAYRVIIIALCVRYGDHVEAEEFLREQGSSTYVIRDKDGKVKRVEPFPQVAISKSALADAVRYAKELGLTPSSAGYMGVDLPETASPHDEDDEHWFAKYNKANR